MPRRLPLIALVAGYVAAFLAFTSAALTAYWLVGGTALLDTLGGALERFARDRSAAALAIAFIVVVAKAGAGTGALALTLARRPSRRLATAAALGGALLALYGGVLALAGAVVLTGVVSTTPTDEHALRWHTFFWDPWFVIWGLGLTVAGITVRRSVSRSRVSRRSGSAVSSVP